MDSTTVAAVNIGPVTTDLLHVGVLVGDIGTGTNIQPMVPAVAVIFSFPCFLASLCNTTYSPHINVAMATQNLNIPQM
jgi:hypothetical protein